MENYLKLFKNKSEYDSTSNKPRWGHCINDVKIYYDEPPAPIYPCNVITYNASDKLIETTSNKTGGLHTESFNTTIINHTFENGVGEIEFADDVTTIGDYAFYGSNGLTSIDMPNCVTTIGNNAFYSCTGLTSVTIPDSVTSIGNYAFNNCNRFTSIDIPDSVTTIGYHAFSYCTSLTRCNIGSGITNISDRVFRGCTSLTSIGKIGSGASVEIPDNVTSIGNGTFYECSGLTIIDIPDSVTSIGDSAFNSCSGLTSITFSENSQLTSIGGGVFRDCRSLENIEFPNSLTTIGAGIFFSCGVLTSCTIGSGITTITPNAFQNAYGLQKLVIYATIPPTFNGTFNSGNESNLYVYVPSESVNIYKTTTGWIKVSNKIKEIV